MRGRANSRAPCAGSHSLVGSRDTTLSLLGSRQPDLTGRAIGIISARLLLNGSLNENNTTDFTQEIPMVALPSQTAGRRTRSYQPRPDEIARECARIRAGWSARETEARAVSGAAVNLWTVPELQAAMPQARLDRAALR
jgi:hypothetical protein